MPEIPEDLMVGDPVLEFRWRLFNAALPLERRHLRAFAANDVGMSLDSWARQHIEWALTGAARNTPDGVLVLKVDEAGRAAMNLEPFEGLEDTSAGALVARAQKVIDDKVPSEVLWCVDGNEVFVAVEESKIMSGANSFIADILKTKKYSVTYVADPVSIPTKGELFLVSDEYGVVLTPERAGTVAERLSEYYNSLIVRAEPYRM